MTLDAHVQDIAEHNARSSPSAFTLWRSSGGRRYLVGRADGRRTAALLAERAGPCAVWPAPPATGPTLVVDREGREVGGAWGLEHFLSDCKLVRAAADRTPVASLGLPDWRVRRAVRALRAGGRMWDGAWVEVKQVPEIRIGMPRGGPASERVLMLRRPTVAP